MRTTLGEICVQDRQIVAPGSDDAERLPYLGLEQIESQTGRILSRESLSESGVGAAFRFDSRHVLYSKLRPYLNKVALAEHEGRCTTELIPLLPVTGVDRDFLACLLRSPAAVTHASSANTGARMPRADLDHLFALEVELPDLSAQRRLATRLKAQMAAVEETRRRVEEQAKAVEKVSDKLLSDVFDTAAADSWPEPCLGELLASPLRTGISKQGLPEAKNRCLTLSSVRNGRLDLSAAKPIELTSTEAARNRVQAGAFYVVRGNGNVRLVGRGAIAPEEVDASVVFPDLLIEVNPQSERLDTEYLRWAWDSPKVRKEVEGRSMTTSGIFKINLGNLAQVPVPLPPLKTQRQIAARLREQFGCLQQLQAALSTQLEALDKLPGAFLREAFGSLTSN